MWLLLRSVFAGAIVIASATSALFAGDDSTVVYNPFNDPAVMHIGYLNPDCVQDTVYGLMNQRLGWIPKYICWGGLYDAEGTALCDSGKYDVSVKKAERRDTTHITMPAWGKLSCALSVEQFNTNDTLEDLIFWVHGIDSVEGSQGEVTLNDTLRGLVLFGQSALSTHKEIEVDKIKDFEGGKYYAMELGYEKELINPKRRDNTKKTSWELKRVSKEVKKKEEEGNRDEGEGMRDETPSKPSVVESEHNARIWPNPAIYTTTVEIKPLSAGSYSVEVVAVNGEQVWSEEVVLESQGEVFETIDVTGLPSGHYVLRIWTSPSASSGRGDEQIGVYPIIVVR